MSPLLFSIKGVSFRLNSFEIEVGFVFLGGISCGCAGNTQVLAAVYGPKAGTKKNENPEKASVEVIWKPKTGQIGEDSFCLLRMLPWRSARCINSRVIAGKQEKEYEMVLKRTLQSICILTIHPNTTTSVIVQVGCSLAFMRGSLFFHDRTPCFTSTDGKRARC